MAAVDLHVRVHGWALIPVGDESDARRPWAYTVGLTETFGHPDLIVTDIRRESAVELIRRAVGWIDDGQLDPVELERAHVRAVQVHRAQLVRDWFAVWSRRAGRPPAPGEFLQLLPPPEWLCPCHRSGMTRLDRPPGTGRTGSRRR